MRMSRLLYSPFLAQLIVTRRCNLQCKYCNEFDNHSPPVPTELLRQRLDRLAELGTWAVDLTGGEALLHPDIFELVRYAKRDKKFHKVMLLSNGYLFSEQVVHRLNEAGLDALQISVDGVEPNAVTVKVLRPLRRKLAYIAAHADFEIRLSGVIGSTRPGEATEVISFAREHGFTPWVQLIHDHRGQLKLAPEALAEYRSISRLLGSRFRESRNYRNRLLRDGVAPFKCRAGSRYLYIDEMGVVRWCSQTREQFGVPLDDYRYPELKRQFYTAKPCADHCTVGCVRTCSSVDQFRRQPLSPVAPQRSERGLPSEPSAASFTT